MADSPAVLADRSQCPAWVVEFVRHATRGLVGLLLHLALLTVLVERGGLAPAVASLVTVPVLMLVGFSLTEGWVFTAHDVPRDWWSVAKRAGAFWSIQHAGGAVKFGLYVGLLQVVPGTAPFYQLAWVAAAVTVFVATFAANRWVWTRARQR